MPTTRHMKQYSDTEHNKHYTMSDQKRATCTPFPNPRRRSFSGHSRQLRVCQIHSLFSAYDRVDGSLRYSHMARLSFVQPIPLLIQFEAFQVSSQEPSLRGDLPVLKVNCSGSPLPVLVSLCDMSNAFLQFTKTTSGFQSPCQGVMFMQEVGLIVIINVVLRPPVKFCRFR